MVLLVPWHLVRQLMIYLLLLALGIALVLAVLTLLPQQHASHKVQQSHPHKVSVVCLSL